MKTIKVLIQRFNAWLHAEELMPTPDEYWNAREADAEACRGVPYRAV